MTDHLSPELDSALGDIAAGRDPYATGRERPMTDLGNAERLKDHQGAELLFDWTRKRWTYWDGRRWAQDSTGEAERRAKGGGPLDLRRGEAEQRP